MARQRVTYFSQRFQSLMVGDTGLEPVPLRVTQCLLASTLSRLAAKPIFSTS